MRIVGADGIHETTKQVPDDSKRLPVWREALLSFFLFATLWIAWHALRDLHRAGQPISEIIIDGVGVGAIYTLLMAASRGFREK
jgi:hypothetical protein